MRTPGAILCCAMLAGCAVAPAQTGHADEPELPDCHAKAYNCRAWDLESVEFATLATHADSLHVMCSEQEADQAIDEAYRERCRHEIADAVDSMNARFAGKLAAIDASALEYSWEGFTCTDGVDFGFCNSFGSTTLPLRWLVAPDASLRNDDRRP